MEIEEVRVTIDRDGKVRIEVSGVKGGACLDVTRSLEAALGGGVESRQMTPEALESLRVEEEGREWLRGGP
jgi:hypothetical protein